MGGKESLRRTRRCVGIARHAASAVAFQRLQALDHRLDAAARLFIARQQAGALTAELLLALPQAAIFIGQAAHGTEQAIYLFGECGQLVLHRVGRRHGGNYTSTFARTGVPPCVVGHGWRVH